MITASVSISSQPKTVGDVRKWLAEVDSLGLSDSTLLDDGLLYIYLSELRTETVECGEHVPANVPGPNDLLVYMHACRTDNLDIPGKPE